MDDEFQEVPSVEPSLPSEPPPPPPSEFVSKAKSRALTLLPIAVIAALIAAVSLARMARRDDGQKTVAGTQEIQATGRSVPATVNIVDGLTKEGAFTCQELRLASGRYTGQVQGGSVKNTSGKVLALGFDLKIDANASSETVTRRFQMQPDQSAPTFLMASKSLASPIQQCTVTMFSDGQASQTQVARLERAAKAAGCGAPMKRQIEGTEHIQPPQRGTYRTTPPTSGQHWNSINPPAPAPTGIHRKPIANEAQIHNLEHGHVGAQYREEFAFVRAALTSAAQDRPDMVFVAPYPGMPQAIALTAWGVSLDCATTPNDGGALTELVQAFVAVYADHAPESVPGKPTGSGGI